MHVYTPLINNHELICKLEQKLYGYIIPLQTLYNILLLYTGVRVLYPCTCIRVQYGYYIVRYIIPVQIFRVLCIKFLRVYKPLQTLYNTCTFVRVIYTRTVFVVALYTGIFLLQIRVLYTVVFPLQVVNKSLCEVSHVIKSLFSLTYVRRSRLLSFGNSEYDRMRIIGRFNTTFTHKYNSILLQNFSKRI